MKTFKDLFLNEAADTNGPPRRTIKASLKMATTDDPLPTRLAPASSDDDDASESEQKKRRNEAAGNRAGNLRQDIHLAGTRHHREMVAARLNPEPTHDL